MILSKALSLVDRIARWAVWIGGALMLFAAILVTFDVLMRRFFGFTVGGSDEISGYLFAVATSWSFAFVLLRRGNVRIDALYLLLPRRVCALLDVLALLALGIFMGFLTERAFAVVTTTIDMGAHSVTPLRTPLVVPQGFWLGGLLLFQVAFVLVFLQAVVALLRGDNATVRRVAGVPSLDEEVVDEWRSGARLRRGPRED